MGALATSTLLYGTETWTIHNAHHTARLHDGYAKSLGLTFEHRQQLHINDEQLRASLGPDASPLHMAITAIRLRYIPRFYRHAPATLYHLTLGRDPPNPWENAVRADLAWLRTHLDNRLCELPNPTLPSPHVADVCFLQPQLLEVCHT